MGFLFEPRDRGGKRFRLLFCGFPGSLVTTAALPWRTGTAVNPLLRALYLTRGRPKHYVSLVIPWCPEEKDRILTLGKDHSFATSEEQEAWIREFCRDRAGCSGKLCLILFV